LFGGQQLVSVFPVLTVLTGTVFFAATGVSAPSASRFSSLDSVPKATGKALQKNQG